MRRLHFVFVVLLGALIGALVANVNVGVKANDWPDTSVTIDYYDWTYTQVEPIIYDTVNHALIGGHITLWASVEIVPEVSKWTKMWLSCQNDSLTFTFDIEFYDPSDFYDVDLSLFEIIDTDAITVNHAHVGLSIKTGYHGKDSEFAIVTNNSIPYYEPTQINGALMLHASDYPKIFEYNSGSLALTNDLNANPVDNIEIQIDIEFYDAPITGVNLPTTIDNISPTWELYEYDLNVNFVDESIPDVPDPTDPDLPVAWWAWISTFIASIAGGFLGISLYPGLTIGLLVAIPFVLTLVAWIIGLIRGRSKPGGRSDDDD